MENFKLIDNASKVVKGLDHDNPTLYSVDDGDVTSYKTSYISDYKEEIHTVENISITPKVINSAQLMYGVDLTLSFDGVTTTIVNGVETVSIEKIKDEIHASKLRHTYGEKFWNGIAVPYSVSIKFGISQVLYARYKEGQKYTNTGEGEENYGKHNNYEYMIYSITSEINDTLMEQDWIPIAILGATAEDCNAANSDVKTYAQGGFDRFIALTNLPTMNLYFLFDSGYTYNDGYVLANTHYNVWTPRVLGGSDNMTKYDEESNPSGNIIAEVEITGTVISGHVYEDDSKAYDYWSAGTSVFNGKEVTKKYIDTHFSKIQSKETIENIRYIIWVPDKSSSETSVPSSGITCYFARNYDDIGSSTTSFSNNVNIFKDKETQVTLELKDLHLTTASTKTDIEKNASPASVGCYIYETFGTSKGDWYVPSFGELYIPLTRDGSNYNNVITTFSELKNSQAFENYRKEHTKGKYTFYDVDGVKHVYEGFIENYWENMNDTGTWTNTVVKVTTNGKNPNGTTKTSSNYRALIGNNNVKSREEGTWDKLFEYVNGINQIRPFLQGRFR